MDPEKSPVADLEANEARERIANMRSVEKLEQIALTDSRVTVAEAASKRLTELGSAPDAKDVKDGKKDELGADDALKKEIDGMKWDGDYPLKSVPGNKALRIIDALDDSDALEVIIHEDKRMSVVDAAKARLRTTSNDRKRQLARQKWGMYRVSYNGSVGDFKARDEKEAWALFNDANKTSFGPKVPGRIVKKIRDLPPEGQPEQPEPGLIPAVA